MIILSLLIDLFFFGWVLLAVAGGWAYYFAFRVRDAWKAVRR